MWIYIIMFWYEVVICFMIDRNRGFADKTFVKDKNIIKIRYKNLIFLLLVLLPIWFIMGFRNGIGTDFNSYRAIFNHIRETGLNGYGMEKGYWCLNVLIGKLTNSEQTIFIVTAFLILYLYLKGMIKTSKQVLIPMISFIGMGYYFYSMNILRQYIAIAIVFSCFHEYEDGKWFRFMIGVIIASLFHTSALIWIPVIILIRFVKGNKFYIITFAFALVSRIFIKKILKIIITYSSYGHFFLSNNGFIRERTSVWNILVSGGTLVVAFLLYKQLININENNEKRIKFIWIMFLGCTFLNVWGDAVIRMVLHFSFVILILVNDIFKCFKERTAIFLKAVYVLMLFVLMVVIVNYGGNFVPYVSCFQNKTR